MCSLQRCTNLHHELILLGPADAQARLRIQRLIFVYRRHFLERLWANISAWVQQIENLFVVDLEEGHKDTCNPSLIVLF
jgi:hypothetical protein